MTRLHVVVLFALLIVAAPEVAQATPCLTNADSVSDFRVMASLPYGSADSAATVATGEPWARYENIQVVTDSLVCAAGIAAYNSHYGFTGTPQAVTDAYIFAYGGTGYAIIIPGETTLGGRRRTIYIFTTTWVYKIGFLT